ncbi:relaxase/mobilization nuclease domain-containing protein [Cellulophaga tyrosinoxydans]|uniref:Relaxase/Mobilisation nuclease domain-containing protein n=1 Tax=Cellulophaga tyrosinoxydans TaxID=504486 RepID=A0A1W1YUR4_9FLAO|nr:relaxase/mobilization nuclease domain-containing protein [Cellulophaga tyrosinoxydans]SMC39876.1 Relaxase/Mobilisation nuclease domain-containing protein [Cellulophaga tyrosinoxydans]
MIGKGKSIAHTKASIAYGWNQEKDAEVVFRQHLAGDTTEQITDEFKLIQEQNVRCQKNTLSFILSPIQEEGKQLSKAQLGELTQKFIKEMNLKNRQAIAFVHRDKAHTHVHLYVNRIGFDGKAYNDSFIGKRSQLAAENVAKEMGLTTVKEVQLEKNINLQPIRQEIKNRHQSVMDNQRPKNLEDYIKAMKAENVKVIPSINKASKLQGFRYEYQGHNLKASEVHRSMSGGGIMGQLAQNNIGIGQSIQLKNTTQLLGKTIELSTNLAASIAKSMLKKVIKRSIDKGIGF